jgi:hypothetical protein
MALRHWRRNFELVPMRTLLPFHCRVHPRRGRGCCFHLTVIGGGERGDGLMEPRRGLHGSVRGDMSWLALEMRNTQAVREEPHCRLDYAGGAEDRQRGLCVRSGAIAQTISKGAGRRGNTPTQILSLTGWERNSGGATPSLYG